MVFSPEQTDYCKASPETRENIRYKRIEKKFGITRSEYVWLWRKQNGVCAICKSPPSTVALGIDHDHAHHSDITKGCRECIRGLLCDFCNTRAVPAMERIPELQNEWAKAYLCSRPLIDDFSALEAHKIINAADILAVLQQVESIRLKKKRYRAEARRQKRRIKSQLRMTEIAVSRRVFKALEACGL